MLKSNLERIFRSQQFVGNGEQRGQRKRVKKPDEVSCAASLECWRRAATGEAQLQGGTTALYADDLFGRILRQGFIPFIVGSGDRRCVLACLGAWKRFTWTAGAVWTSRAQFYISNWIIEMVLYFLSLYSCFGSVSPRMKE